MKRSQYFRAACQWNEMESRRVLQCSRADRLLFLKWNIRSSISSPYAKAPGQVVSIHCFQLCIKNSMHSGLLVLHWGFSRLKPHPHNFALQIANVSDFIHSPNVHFPYTFFSHSCFRMYFSLSLSISLHLVVFPIGWNF